MIACSTRGSAAASTAALARASSASTSTIGHTATPSARSASSSQSNWARSSGSTPALDLYVGHHVVAEGLDDVIGRHADVRRAILEEREDRLHHTARRTDLDTVAVAMPRARRVILAKDLISSVDEMNDHLESVS